jgi:dipeptidase E
VAERQILAIGGYPWGTALEAYLLEIARGDRICFVPTAAAEEPEYLVNLYESFGRRARPSHLLFHPWPPQGLRDFVLSQDVIYVPGGNTANMLAIWRVHGLDGILREAWESGVVLAGWSAGMICWFEDGVTDSFGPDLQALGTGLGFLPGSACPHYDGEEFRRPRYHQLIRDGALPGGYAADDRVGLLFRGTELAEVVAARNDGAAYRVELVDGEVVETRIEARPLE